MSVPWAIIVHPHWCRICQQRPVTNRDDACPGCLGHIENQLEPITRWPAKPPPRPGLWARAWAWAEQHMPDWTADLGGDD